MQIWYLFILFEVRNFFWSKRFKFYIEYIYEKLTSSPCGNYLHVNKYFKFKLNVKIPILVYTARNLHEI